MFGLIILFLSFGLCSSLIYDFLASSAGCVVGIIVSLSLILAMFTPRLLKYNQIEGSIPTEFGVMSSLAHITIDHNRLTGPLPTELGQLSELGCLDFYHNQLSGTVPSEIGLLTKLTYLDFGRL